MKNKRNKRISGTLEWAVANANCCNGCSHGCLYCYARWNACDRFGLIAHEDWTNKQIRTKDVRKKRKNEGGTVMFPTTHDICPDILDDCIQVIQNVLDAGNDILIVSKPHLDCISVICDRFIDFRDKILFRFTIGAFDNETLAHWEPGAPNFEERLQSLQLAHERGYKTSISIEPMLDSPQVTELFRRLEPWVTDSIWIGKMNHIRSRVHIETLEDEEWVYGVEQGQANECIHRIYEALKDEPKVRWKESIKEVIGIALETKPGTDK